MFLQWLNFPAETTDSLVRGSNNRIPLQKKLVKQENVALQLSLRQTSFGMSLKHASSYFVDFVKVK